MNDFGKKLAAIEKSLMAIKQNMATKDDIRNMATRDDIRNMATRDDIRNMATKDDLKKLEVKLLKRMEESEMEIIQTVEKHKADKESVKVLEKRVEHLEDNAGFPPYLD